MKGNSEGKRSLIEDLRALNTKQIIAMVASLLIALLLQAFGFAEQCIGFLIIAALLYMIPHVLGVFSVKVKAVHGIVFVVIALLITTFYSGPSLIDSVEKNMSAEKDDFGNITYDVVDGNTTITIDFYITDVDNVKLDYGVVNSVNYRTFGYASHDSTPMTLTPTSGGKTTYIGTATVPVDDGKLCGYQITYEKKVTKDDGTVETQTGRTTFFADNGASSSDIWMISFNGLCVYVGFTALMFFMILIFSAIMRRSAEKTRVKMEADGRLYPQGYGRCKECGAMVLPGEVTCRKCGAYIDVPEEIRAHKKDYFVCEECGAEVPNDATVCPKCGAKFDSTETEIQHADGSVDVSDETFECSECGAIVPANASRCPKCGATFDEKDE